MDTPGGWTECSHHTLRSSWVFGFQQCYKSTVWHQRDTASCLRRLSVVQLCFSRRRYEGHIPALIPVDLGSMGYEGEESMYVTKEVLQQALDAEGLTLNFYRRYNLTHHNPKQYFDGMDAIDLADLFLCEETDFYKPESMAAYARWTGDAAGVQVLVNGKYAAKCHADKCWISPQCRTDTSTCIPVVTAGVGWKLQAMTTGGCRTQHSSRRSRSPSLSHPTPLRSGRKAT